MGAPTKVIKRDVIKTIRMTSEEWLFIQAAADQARLKPTTYIIQCVSSMSQLHVDFVRTRI